mmetsp:Transcript_20575/g.51926  ORF Transcript_20575/g.51926 Transcript_20575/m.51926 type:complete len:200 (-) Transcript_20575:359-958(-)
MRRQGQLSVSAAEAPPLLLQRSSTPHHLRPRLLLASFCHDCQSSTPFESTNYPLLHRAVDAVVEDVALTVYRYSSVLASDSRSACMSALAVVFRLFAASLAASSDCCAAASVAAAVSFAASASLTESVTSSVKGPTMIMKSYQRKSEVNAGPSSSMQMPVLFQDWIFTLSQESSQIIQLRPLPSMSDSIEDRGHINIIC